MPPLCPVRRQSSDYVFECQLDAGHGCDHLIKGETKSGVKFTLSWSTIEDRAVNSSAREANTLLRDARAWRKWIAEKLERARGVELHFTMNASRALGEIEHALDRLLLP